MKTFCVLAVVVVAVTASPECSSYCNKLYSGWEADRRSDCNCDALEKELQDGLKYEHDLKSILLPGFLPSEIKLNKIKRSLPDGDIPVERAHNSTITSKSSDDVLNNSQIIAMNFSDCIDLLISISIRKNKNKSIAKSLEKNNNLNNLEINTEIKNKCQQASAIPQKSVEEIKEHEKDISKKNRNVDVIPKLDIRSAFDLTDEKTPTTSTNDNKGINSTVKSTPYEKPYTNDNTTILDSVVNDFNLSKTLKDNIQEETKKSFKKDNDNTTNLNVSTTSTKLNNLPTTKVNISSLSYKLKNLKQNPLNYEFTSRNPLTFERIQNESKLMADYSDNVNKSTSISNQNITNNNKSDKTVNQNGNNTSLRDRYEENFPIVNIITREFPNNTISSFLNGTETLTYSKFEEDEIINNNNTENTNDSRPFESIESELEIRSHSDETTPSTSEEQSSEIMSPAINGRLFFEYAQEYIPGQFVQSSDGRLHLSLDMNTICDELIQKGKHNSLLISILCQCLSKKYQSMEYGI